jgi:hypothetical protein
LTQPQSGYSATTEQVLIYYLLYLPLWVLIVATILIIKKHVTKNWYKITFTKRTLYWTLVFLIVIGFVTNHDYQRQVGCFVENEPDFSSTKFIFSLGSILLLSSGFYFSDKKIGLFFLITEFFIWTSKSLYFNCSLDLFLPGYFMMICWAVRLVFIVKILNMRSIDKPTVDKKTNR